MVRPIWIFCCQDPHPFLLKGDVWGHVEVVAALVDGGDDDGADERNALVEIDGGNPVHFDLYLNKMKNINLLDIQILREINFAHLKDHSMNYDEAEDGDLEVRDGDDDCESEASPTWCLQTFCWKNRVDFPVLTKTFAILDVVAQEANLSQKLKGWMVVLKSK